MKPTGYSESNFFFILKALLREKLTAIQSHLRKQEKSQKHHNLTPKELKKEENKTQTYWKKRNHKYQQK